MSAASGRLTVPLLLAALAAPLAGQDRPVEVGVDGAIKIVSESDGMASHTEVAFPVHAVRVGVEVAPHLAVEVSGSFDHVSEEDEWSTRLLVFPSVVLSGSAEGGVGAFVTLGAGVTHVRLDGASGEQSDTQLGFGGQFGLRGFLSQGFALRFALGLTHWKGAELMPSQKYFAFLFGFSAYP